jgi:hypothetical protein
MLDRLQVFGSVVGPVIRLAVVVIFDSIVHAYSWDSDSLLLSSIAKVPH